MKLATALRAGLALSRTPLGLAAPSSAAPVPGLDVAAIDRVLGATGKLNGGVLQYAIPRREPIHDGDMAVPPAMGTAISINFQSVGASAAATTGDFVLVSSEVNPVIKALHSHGIEVTALHSHMLNEEPRLFFLHFWAHGPATSLAAGLAAALAQTNARRS